MVDFHETAAAEASVAIGLVPGPEARAEVDRTLVQQALGNLISNAIARTPSARSRSRPSPPGKPR